MENSSPNRAQAAEAMREDADPKGVTALQFTQVTDYTTFRAEYTLKGADLVMHFFTTPEVENHAKGRAYWLQVFPTVLSPTAEEHFGATAPRLQAQYIEMVNSWWFQAQGYDHLIALDSFVAQFCEKLDAALEVTGAL